MSAEPWLEPAWLQAHAAELRMEGAWRGVETQYIAASMKLVDSLQEQALLEELLEASKPAAPAAPAGQHYLLLSPFRYFPQHGSRFRPAHHSGLWYGAATLEGACSEIAYWRMRFLLDSAGLAAGELLTEHTFFQASVRGRAINLMAPPWVEFSHLWKHGSDYGATQRLAAAAIGSECIQWIQYESVRKPSCALAAALVPGAVHAERARLEKSKQEWVCKTTRDVVLMIQKNGPGRFSWSE